MKRTMTSVSMAAIVMAAWMSGTMPVAAQTSSAPDQAIKDVIYGIADGKPVVLWQALPASYQKEIKSLISEAAEKMDADVHDKTFAVLRKAVKLLKDKKAFILNADLAAPVVTEDKKKSIGEGYDATVMILETLANSELSKLSDLKKADVEKFLTGTAPKLGSQVMTLVNVADAANPGNPEVKKFHDGMANLKKAKITVLKSSANEATVKVEMPGEKDAKEQTLVVVEGKWLPKEMVDGWDVQMKKAHQAIKQSPPIKDEIKNSVVGILSMVDGNIDELAKAQTQKDFNETVKNIVGAFIPGVSPKK